MKVRRYSTGLLVSPRFGTGHFTRDVVKSEIFRHVPFRHCCQETLLNLFLALNPSKGHILAYSGMKMARFLLTLLKRLGVKSWGLGVSKKSSKRGGRILFQESFKIRRKVKSSSLREPRSGCCLRSFLKGFYLLRGFMSFPKHGYHLEMAGLTKEQARLLLKVLKKAGCPGRFYFRRGHPVVFLKSGETIARFLGLLGAEEAFLRFEEFRALRETKNEVRRQVNYESANLERTLGAAARQARVIRAMMKQERWRRISAALRKVALKRLEFPHLSLRELAKKLHVSKSALNHRFRRLEAIQKRARSVF